VAQTIPPVTLKRKNRGQGILLAPARKAASARRTATKRPKNSTLPPCFINRDWPSLTLAGVMPRLGPTRISRCEPTFAHPEADVVPDHGTREVPLPLTIGGNKVIGQEDGPYLARA